MRISSQQLDVVPRILRKRAENLFCDLTAPVGQTFPGSGQTLARLFQKLVRFAIQPLGNANQTGQRKIVFAAFNAADICPVHVRALGERFLRQTHFFPIRAHVLCHTLAILVFHARQVWKKKVPSNIDVTTIVFNTRQPPHTLAECGLPIPVESPELRPGACQAGPDGGLRVFPKCHRKNLDGMRKHGAGYFRVK